MVEMSERALITDGDAEMVYLSRYTAPRPGLRDGEYSMTDIVSNIVERELFRRSQNGQWAAGQLVGRP